MTYLIKSLKKAYESLKKVELWTSFDKEKTEQQKEKDRNDLEKKLNFNASVAVNVVAKSDEQIHDRYVL